MDAAEPALCLGDVVVQPGEPRLHCCNQRFEPGNVARSAFGEGGIRIRDRTHDGSLRPGALRVNEWRAATEW